VAFLCVSCTGSSNAPDPSVPAPHSENSITYLTVWFSGRAMPISGLVCDVHGQRVSITEDKENVRLRGSKRIWIDLSSPTIERWELEDGLQRLAREWTDKREPK
jgi:hypothetical protein